MAKRSNCNWRFIRLLAEALPIVAACHGPALARPLAVSAASGGIGSGGVVCIEAEDVSLVDWTPASSRRPYGAQPAGASGVQLALAVTVNRQDRGIALVREDAGNLYVTREVLGRLGIVAPLAGPDQVRLTGLEGAQVEYRVADQALDIIVPAALLDASLARLNVSGQEVMVATAEPGIVLNHDLFAQVQGHDVGLNGLAGLRAFAGNAVFETSQVANWSPGSRAGLSTTTRLDTTLALSWPERRLSLRLGDVISASVPWSRATRMGGIQFGTNFALQPYLATAPIPSFAGSAALPSQVELIMNGMRRFAGYVPAGPFEIAAGPGRGDGAGRAELVLTDVLGRVTRRAFSTYETPRLLRPGLSEWSVEIGAVRRDHGLRSFAYDTRPGLSASWRRGLSDRLTIEAHGEASAGLAQLGAGGAFLLGPAGVISASLAASQGSAGGGSQLRASYAWSNGSFNVSGTMERTSPGFADLASRWGGPPPRRSVFAQAGHASRLIGSVGASYSRIRRQGQPDQAFAGLYWSRPVGRTLSLHASFNRGFGRHAPRVLQFSLSYAPGKRHHVSFNQEHGKGHDAQTLLMQQSVPTSGGLGWRADLRRVAGAIDGMGELTWLGPAGQLDAGVSSHGSGSAGFAGYRGSLVLAGGGLFAARRIDDSFAVVSTGGVAGVPVLLENNRVGVTNADGLLLVSGLHAYERNRIGIDQSRLPADLLVDAVELAAVPADRAGVSVRFGLRLFTAVTATVVDRDDAVLPPGTPVAMAGSNDDLGAIGFDGQLYVEQPTPGAVLVAADAAGRRCVLRLPQAIKEGQVTRLGTMTCENQP